MSRLKAFAMISKLMWKAWMCEEKRERKIERNTKEIDMLKK